MEQKAAQPPQYPVENRVALYRKIITQHRNSRRKPGDILPKVKTVNDARFVNQISHLGIGDRGGLRLTQSSDQGAFTTRRDHAEFQACQSGSCQCIGFHYHPV
jgi:hypothetical protein